jgi:FG-GAP repeat protein
MLNDRMPGTSATEHFHTPASPSDIDDSAREHILDSEKLSSGDFNGDGIPDVLWKSAATGATSEWQMSASGGIGANPATAGSDGLESGRQRRSQRRRHRRPHVAERVKRRHRQLDHHADDLSRHFVARDFTFRAVETEVLIVGTGPSAPR